MGESDHIEPPSRLEQLLYLQAFEQPDGAAIEDEQGTLDYKTALLYAQRIAHELLSISTDQDIQSHHNSAVGLCLNRGTSAVVALLGILISGCCYVPLQADAGTERLRRVVELASLKVILVDNDTFQPLSDKLRNTNTDARPRLVNVQALLIDTVGCEPLSRETVTSASSTAYTIYSSGTTGVPKGIMMSHSSVLQYLDASRHTFKAMRHDRWLHAAPYTFDVSVEEIFVPLAAGACIVCQPRQGLETLTGYLDFLNASRITAVSMPTALWHRLSAHLVDNTEDDLPSNLRLVVIGGEAARTDAYRQWSSVTQGRGIELVNAYGPTECCVSATFGTIFAQDNKVMNIGKPLPGMRAYVVERDSNTLVPDGQIGRLLLSGPQLALGYLGDGPLTATKFFPNPFAEGPPSRPYGRVYDTGDLVFRTPTGELTFCGRVDMQLQVRGQRVEAEGVESVLAGCPSVAEAAILVTEEQGTEAMVAFLVPHDGHAEEVVLRQAEMRCAADLMPFEKPSHLVWLAKLPLTANGKVDKSALAEVWARQKEKNASPHTLAPLTTDTERALADLWREVLCLESPSIHLGRTSTLVQLGGHSLTFVSLTSKIYKHFKLRVTVTELARHQALSDMAAFLDSLPRHSAERPSVSYTADEPFDLTLPQQLLYLAQSKEPHSPFFNDGVAIEIEGWCDLVRLESAVQCIVQRHEALRCVLVKTSDGDKVQQCLLPWSQSLWETMWHPQNIRADSFEGVSANIFSTPLDLFCGPLIKVHLLQGEGGRRSVLIVQAHHIIWDGFSDGIFLEELATFYRDLNAALETAAPFRDIFASLSMRRDASATGELSEYLRGVPEAVDLPADLASPAQKSYSRGGVIRFTWNAESVHRAIAAATGRTLTPTSLALAIYAVVLRRFAGGQNDFALGVPMANRTTPEAASTIGFFVNMLPFRLQVEEEHRLADVLDSVEAGLATLFRNQDVVLADVYRRQQSSGSTHERLLKFCFSFQNAPEGRLSPECTFKRWPLHNGAARAELTCFTELCADGSISGELEYDADLFERSTILSMTDCMAHTLREIAWRQAWECPLGQLSLVKTQPEDDTPAAVSQDGIGSPTSLGTYLLDAIESHALDVAIIDEVSNCCITYAELAQRAKSLAQRINSCAPGNMGPVLLLLGRSWEVPAAQIASALASRPWICCDIGQPRERTTRIISQSNPSCIIAEQRVFEDLFVELSECPAPVIYADKVVGGDSDAGCESLAGDQANGIAYIIYTSGTTGTPKGVAIEQLSFMAFLEHIKSWLAQPGAPTSFNSMLTSNTAFDGSLSQIYSALATGGRLIISKTGGEQDGEYVAVTLNKYAVNYLCTTTAAARLWMTQAAESYPRFFGPHFRYLLLGGDELAPKFVSQIFSRSQCPAQVEVKNVYGPTEGTIFSSYGTYRLPDLAWLERRRRSPIDTVLPNAAISIVGPDLYELPVGAVGEIVIWGSCLAREYIDLPELNAAKFITRDSGSRGKLRGWKTGDLGRKTISGGFEVLGRLDSMRKVLGGFRVDLEEIKQAIVNHGRVRECHVSIVEEENDGVKENKLVAHVALHPSEEQSTVQLKRDLETVANYETMFTDVNQSLDEYSEEEVNLSFDYRGWASSFDRSTIPKEDMKEWVDCTVARILEQDCFKGGNKPRVAEIGCGTGMILFSLADRVSSYYGVDLAAPTVAQVKKQAQKLGHSHVRTAALPAHDFDNGLELEEQFDLIICNSVSQYFPSLAYLDNVVRRARTRLAPGGSLFMGDIRHDGLKAQHAATSAFFRGAKTVSELRQSAADILDKDKELQVDPSFFVAKCGGPDRLFPGDIRIELRRGTAPTEMTLFRYDAVLMTMEHEIPSARFRTVDWKHDWVSEPHLLPRVRPGADADIIVFPELPNKRVQTSDCLRSIADPESKHGVDCQVSTLLLQGYRKTQIAWDPEALLSQVQAEGFQGIILPSPGSPASFDLIITSSPFLAAGRHWASTRLSSVPMLSPAEQLGLCQREVMPSIDRRALFSHLFHKVPRYMIPHYVICINQLPLAGTGKVDAKLLPQPGSGDLFSGAFEARLERSAGDKADSSVSKDVLPLAQKIAAIFTEVLNKPENDRCSVHDDFFFSGGHSIIAAKAVQVIRKRLGLVVPFTAILAHPTSATLATRLAEIGRFQDQASDIPPPMMLLQPSETSQRQRDVVVMHPIGGGLLPMADLVDAIGARLKDTRILGVPWSHEHVGGAETIDDIAQIYAGIISDFYSRRATRASKLTIVGWSFGGTLAYETCKRLQLAYSTAIQVVLLDSPTVEVAVRNVNHHALAAGNYAEQVIEYIESRNASDTKEKYRSWRQGTSHEIVQGLTKTFLDHKVHEQMDLRALPPLVRQNLRVPAWVTDSDLVEALRGLQKNLQVICGTARQKSRESLPIPDNLNVSVLQLQASDGLSAQLSSEDLGWEAELARQDGMVDWVKQVVDGGHDELLISSMNPKVVNLIADRIMN